MSEFIDGWTAQRIIEFWTNPGSHSYSHHSLCQEYSRQLEKGISELTLRLQVAESDLNEVLLRSKAAEDVALDLMNLAADRYTASPETILTVEPGETFLSALKREIESRLQELKEKK